MKGLCLIFWMLLTLILTCSVVGMLLFVPTDRWKNHDSTPSTWMRIGRKLLDAVVNQK